MSAKLSALVFASLLTIAPLANAQTSTEVSGYPNRPIHVIVPFPPGGGIDVAMRIIGQELGDAVGQPVVIDNRAGAGGVIGTDAGAKAARRRLHSDCMHTWPDLDKSRPALQTGLRSRDRLRAGQHAGHRRKRTRRQSGFSCKVCGGPDRTRKITAGGLNFASSGVGTSQHLSGELLKFLAKVNFVHVPYKGTGAALADLMGGRVDFAFADPSVLTLVKSGQLRALAVTTPKRYAAAPDVPTVAEAGLPGFQATNWYCMLAPAATPKPIISRLNSEIVKILDKPEIRAKLLEQNIEASSSTPEELGGYLRDDIARWTTVVNAAGLKTE